jgi:glycosyltransferase involved in cell wall biosynthesis
LKENGGQASAFNAGFAASKGAIICFLDSDDCFLPDKVEMIVQAFGEHSDIGWVFHALRVESSDAIASKVSKSNLKSGRYDFRSQLRRWGRVPFAGPATSGLCLSREVAAKILPMPIASNVSLSDKYIKRLSMALSPGVFINHPLGIQRIHDDNAFTLQEDTQQLKARINVLTGYWIRSEFPEFSRLANGIFAFGIAEYLSTREVEICSRPFVKEYLSDISIWGKMEIGMRMLYYRIKYMWGLTRISKLIKDG